MKLVLDSGIIIAFAALEKDKSLDSIEKILNLTKSKKIEAFISSITIAEVFTCFCRRNDAKKAVEISLFLEEIGIEPVNVNKEIAKNSGVLKSKYKMSFADAIIVATAIDRNAHLIAYDKEFEQIKEIRILKPEDFVKML